MYFITGKILRHVFRKFLLLAKHQWIILKNWSEILAKESCRFGTITYERENWCNICHKCKSHYIYGHSNNICYKQQLHQKDSAVIFDMTQTHPNGIQHLSCIKAIHPHHDIGNHKYLIILFRYFLSARQYAVSSRSLTFHYPTRNKRCHSSTIKNWR